MNIQMLTGFLMWCLIMNGALLLFWTAVLLLAPDFIYRTQRKFFPISREQFDLLMYGFLGGYKLLILFFNAIPYLALLIVG
jgi:hypothetical protein